MSSNTLRGIGQEGGGEDGGGGDDQGDDQDEQNQPDAKKLFDGLQQLRTVRSLDSTVPGTRSLDSSVPNAEPSLDAKVPSLAATMMGLPAPVISGREQGTVQGRDVHLPVEMQRMAGMRPVAQAHEAVANTGEHSEPRLAEPAQPAPLPESTGEFIHGHHGHGTGPHPRPDLTSHAPWYEQEPTSEGVYDDPKPNLLGRVALGVAIVAAISVVLFAAAVRLRAQNAAEQQAVTTVPDPPTLIVSTPVPSLMPEPEPTAPAGPPTPGAVAPAAVAPAPVAPAPVAPDTAPVVESKPTSRPPGAPPASRPGRTVAASPGRPQATAPTRAGAASRGQATGQSTAATPGPTATARPAFPMRESTTSNTPAAPPPSIPQPAAEAEPPALPPQPPKQAAPERARGKPYDPDSTLPLNIE